MGGGRWHPRLRARRLLAAAACTPRGRQRCAAADAPEAGVPLAWREEPIPSWLVPATLSAFGASGHYLAIPDPSELLFKPGALLSAAKLRWVNPIEATYRREARWDESSRLPVQFVDFLARGMAFLGRAPSNLSTAWKISRRGSPPASDPETG